jgi:hypothetical protein
MTKLSQRILVAFALVIVPGGVSWGQDESKPDAAEPPTAAKPTRSELKDRQIDVSLEARDIERVLSKLKRASELSKQRITEAAKVAESASLSLEKGDSKSARDEAKQTAEMFKEIARQLEALLKEETPQRIAEAKQLAQQLARAERQFAEKLEGAMNPVQANGKGKGDPRSQVKPMTDPDMKSEGSQSQNGSKGRNGDKKDGDKKDGDKQNGEAGAGTNPADKPKDGDKKTPEGGAGKDPSDKPNGGGGSKGKDEPKDGSAEKPGSAATPGGSDDGDDKRGDKTNPPGGAGKDSGDKPQTGGSGQETDDSKNKDDRDKGGPGSGKPDETKRDGSGTGAGVDRMNDKRQAGGGPALTAAQLREMVAERAGQLAESGKTLQDVLKEIAKSTDPNDKDAVAKIQEVLKEIDIDKLVEEMGQVAGMIRSKKDSDAKLSSLDVADRLQIMAQRLDAAYRVIVAPQAEELRKLEQALLDLRERLEQLETPSQVAGWHRDARELLNELDKLGVSLEAREEFEKEMKKAGFGIEKDPTKRTPDWSLVDGRYVAPDGYAQPLLHLQEDIQERIQTLILGDLGNISDDATPPKYQELVEQYYKVLSQKGGKSGTPAKKPETRKSK